MKKFFIPLEIIPRRLRRGLPLRNNPCGDPNTPRKFLTGFIFAAISLGFFLGFSAGASNPFDITFPIPELDNCADRDSCKTFCDDLAHKDACFAFAKKHGLADANAEERIKNLPPTGPGGCNFEESCKTYCDDVGHQEECIAFAEEHGLMTRDEAARNRKLATGPGGCKGERECHAYCEDTTHQDECFDFAIQNGFIDKKEAAEFKKQREQFKKLQDESPGGCKNEQECKAYCEDSAHIDECVNFAEEHGFMSREEAARVRKVGIAGGPGGCKGEKECHMYCEDPAHQTECIDFAEQNGFMSKEEVARARKFIGKTGPGGCRGEECRNYCNDPAHHEECLVHAEREGLLPRDEIERIRKFTRAAENGAGPGGCKGTQCRDYCADPAHQEECFAFSKNNGLMRPDEEKEFERGKKIQEKVRESGGPGGCRDDEACRLYCTDSAHTEECVAYAVAHGGMTDVEAREMLRHFLEQKFQGSEQFHPSGDFQQFQEGSVQRFEEFRQLEENFRGKFEGKFPGGMPQGFDGKNRMFEQGGMMPKGEEGRSMQPSDMHFAGPGGCTTPDECIKYCTEHKEECFQFGPPGKPLRRPPEGGISPGEGRLQIRTDIMHEFRPSDLPEGFDKMSQDQREEFFRSRFGGRSDEMRMMRERGEPPQGFRGFESGRPPFPQGRPEGEQDFSHPPQRYEFPSDMTPEARERFLQQIRERPEMFGPFTMPPESERAPFEGIGPVPGTPGVFGPMHMPPEGFDPSQGTLYPTEQYRPPDGAQSPAQYPQEGMNYRPPQEGQYQYVPHEGGGTAYPSQYPTEPQMISPPVTGDLYIPPPIMPPSTITPESFPVAPPSMSPPEGSFSPPPPPPGAEASSLEDFFATILLNFLR